MRLWLKLVVMLGLAAGAQWWLDRNATAIEQARLGLWCAGRMMVNDHGRYNEETLAAADRLREQRMRRVVAAAR